MRKTNFQNGINFQSIFEFEDYISSEQLKIYKLLDNLIQDHIPNVTRKLTYNVPFYYLKTRVLYIWPSDVPWGKVKKEGVILGFCQGYKIEDDLKLLEINGRKQIRTLTFYNTDDVLKIEDIVKSYISIAAEINLD